MLYATDSSSTENVKKLARVAAGKETAIGTRCKAQLLIAHILNQFIEGVGWQIFKKKKKCKISKYQKIRSQISIL